MTFPTKTTPIQGLAAFSSKSILLNWVCIRTDLRAETHILARNGTYTCFSAVFWFELINIAINTLHILQVQFYAFFPLDLYLSV